MKIPIPSPRELRWSFIIGLVLLVAGASLLGWVIVQRVNQSNAIVRIAANNAEQVHRLSVQLDQQSLMSVALAAQTAKDRAVLSGQNTVLLHQNTALQTEVKALIRYLRNHGITVPANVVTPLKSGTAASNRPKVPPSPRPPLAPENPGPPPGTASIITELCAVVRVPLLCR